MGENKDILEFCNDVMESKQREKEGKEKYTFKVARKYSYDYIAKLELDDEDIEYLFRKYSKKLKDELNKNINSLTDEYDGVIEKVNDNESS